MKFSSLKVLHLLDLVASTDTVSFSVSVMVTSNSFMRAASLAGLLRKKRKKKRRQCLYRCFRFFGGRAGLFAAVLRIRYSLMRCFESVVEIVVIFAALVAAVAMDVYVAVDVDGYVHG